MICTDKICPTVQPENVELEKDPVILLLTVDCNVIRGVLNGIGSVWMNKEDWFMMGGISSMADLFI